MQEFITKFKQTSYYEDLFNVNDEIILIYIGGSRCFGTNTEISDFDITIVTLGNDFTDMLMRGHLSEKGYPSYLEYNNKKIHWYYKPIKNYFNPVCTDIYGYTGNLTLNRISDKVILYKNPKYEKVLEELLKLKRNITIPVCYEIFNYEKEFVKSTLDKEAIAPKRLKQLYFLCLTSYYLLNEPLDIDFLRTIKQARFNKNLIKDCELKVFKRLKQSRDFIEQNPIDIKNILENLYKQFESKVSKHVH